MEHEGGRMNGTAKGASVWEREAPAVEGIKDYVVLVAGQRT